ncbi:MAG: hypothetical protein NT077_03365 [Candidatus Taylorbacteria bacterium]|nr:hypothetical protein [Candidatus Taylorbacteria bacterium]
MKDNSSSSLPISPEERAALVRYVKLFLAIEEIQPDRERHAELPKLRAELCNLRLAHGWQFDTRTHLNLVVRAAEVLRVEAQAKVDKTERQANETANEAGESV